MVPVGEGSAQRAGRSVCPVWWLVALAACQLQIPWFQHLLVAPRWHIKQKHKTDKMPLCDVSTLFQCPPSTQPRSHRKWCAHLCPPDKLSKPPWAQNSRAHMRLRDHSSQSLTSVPEMPNPTKQQWGSRGMDHGHSLVPAISLFIRADKTS